MTTTKTNQLEDLKWKKYFYGTTYNTRHQHEFILCIGIYQLCVEKQGRRWHWRILYSTCAWYCDELVKTKKEAQRLCLEKFKEECFNMLEQCKYALEEL